MYDRDTKTLTLTDEEVLARLEQAVAEKGEDYAYQQPESTGACQYFDPEHEEWNEETEEYIPSGGWKPGCLIGHVLAYEGVQWRDIDVHNDDPVDVLIRYAFQAHVSDRGREALLRAQRIQDGGGSWGGAVAEARTVLRGTK